MIPKCQTTLKFVGGMMMVIKSWDLLACPHLSPPFSADTEATARRAWAKQGSPGPPLPGCSIPSRSCLFPELRQNHCWGEAMVSRPFHWSLMMLWVCGLYTEMVTSLGTVHPGQTLSRDRWHSRSGDIWHRKSHGAWNRLAVGTLPGSGSKPCPYSQDYLFQFQQHSRSLRPAPIPPCRPHW
jgi:hypothetical protein